MSLIRSLIEDEHFICLFTNKIVEMLDTVRMDSLKYKHYKTKHDPKLIYHHHTIQLSSFLIPLPHLHHILY